MISGSIFWFFRCADESKPRSLGVLTKPNPWMSSKDSCVLSWTLGVLRTEYCWIEVVSVLDIAWIPIIQDGTQFQEGSLCNQPSFLIIFV